MSKALTKEQREKKDIAFKASREYHRTLNNYLGVQRNRLASDTTLTMMYREVEVAKKKMELAEANASY